MIAPSSKPPAYRAYIIGSDGRIKLAYEIDCKSDDEAMTAAQQYVDGHAVELWDRGRKVAVLPPIEQPPHDRGEDTPYQ